ncbi:telomere-associated recq protein [Rutstroemia sp. NJR-2017a WRK4]|nr:telomere-associated recq protein [Rutstroemia sp. NJR-2017a WRK4]
MFFSYNPVHQVASCIIPGSASQTRHLRAEPHRLAGEALKTAVQLLGSYQLRTVDELRAHKPRIEDQCPMVEHLACYPGFYCLQPACQYSTRHFREMRKHMPAVHQIKAAAHETTALWKEVTLQTYFTGHGRIDYFVVVDVDGKDKEKGLEPASDSVPLTQPEKELFEKLEQDCKEMKCDLEEQAAVVQDIGDSRSERVPWLHDLTGFPYHLTTLKDEEIWSSYKLPPKKELEAGGESAADPDLVRILGAAEAVLREAYRLCSDTSPDRKMTQQRANILNGFYTGASGKACGFRCFKNASVVR